MDVTEVLDCMLSSGAINQAQYDDMLPIVKNLPSSHTELLKIIAACQILQLP